MDYMARALELARKALGTTSPNPAVGTVIVREGAIVGEGFTQPPGSSHAEVMALRQAGERARGATIYVTLEPCSHFGRTPPCTRAIIEAGIAEVHLAALDPNPRVSGRGRAELEAAGISIHFGEHETEAREINEAYFKFITTGQPFVTVKFAMSLDGKIATRTGDSRWISGPQSRQYVHCLRRKADAIMVGVNTVLADDPQLTARDSRGKVIKAPLRVIVDCHGRTPPSARAFQQPGQTLLAVGESLDAEEAEGFVQVGAEVLSLPSKKGLVDIKELLRVLGQREITSLLAEGGGTLLASLFEGGLVDKVYAFVAPLLIGGKEARTAVAGKGVGGVAEALRLSGVQVKRFGQDILVSGYIGKG
jgi:diaminohydroxyphosphoribosylaminopyrimidine deaminase/5-amino-6-(5-phosphoribosylamino)uracil reductase